MYFRVLDLPMPAPLLAQCAHLASEAYTPVSSRKIATPAEARVYLLKYMTTPRALVCVGIEGDDVCGLSVGVVETRTWPAMFLLSVFCVSPARQSKGFGNDLLEFTLAQAHSRGADFAHIALPLAPAAHSFLVGKGFRPDEDGVHLRFPLSAKANGVISAGDAALMFGTDEPA